MADTHAGNAATLGAIGNAYRRSTASITAEAERIAYNFQKRYELSGAEAEAYLSAPTTYEEYKAIEAKLVPQLLKLTGPARDSFIAERGGALAFASSRAYAWRISRQQALQANLDAEIMALASKQEGVTAERLAWVYPEVMNRTSYDIQKGLGLFISYARPGTARLEQVLRNPWSGANYSQNIWKSAEKLRRTLNDVITKGLLTGQTGAQMAWEIESRMHAGYSNAIRLVRTETTYIANQAILESYKANGVERYLYIATLDDRTSEICRDLDGQVFRVDEARAGVNLPPTHPNCRSVTGSVTDADTLARMERMAVDPDTGATESVPASMNYRQWQSRRNARDAARAESNRKPLGSAASAARPTGMDEARDSANRKALGTAASAARPTGMDETRDSANIADQPLSLLEERITSVDLVMALDAGRGIGSKRKNHEVFNPEDGMTYELAEGGKVQDAEVTAGYKGGEPLDEDTLARLVETYGGDASKWRRLKGKAWVRMGDNLVWAEIYWFQEPTVGMREFEIKRRLD
jgi:SPP1 gp7 family putative phage head morphogenesis protein